MLVLKNTSFETINSIKKIYETDFKKKIKSPLIVTEEYIHASSDVFPIEFLSFKDEYKLLYGKDVLKDLNIKPEDLRTQCESNIKGRLIVLQQAYLQGSEPGSLLQESFPFFYITLKNMSRLSADSTGLDPESVLTTIQRDYRVDCSVFRKILEQVQKGKLGKSFSLEVFPAYMDQLALISIAIDS